MNKNKKNISTKAKHDLLKTFGIEHLNDEDFQKLRELKLDKNSMCWAVRHISECSQCCLLAPKLTAHQIKDALTDTP